ncbi:MAG: selenide, water dikinase SelD [Rhodospirillales bacterium]|nr:selenide, water dikinase SelD [Rhodospirillales bacterium]
MKATDIPIVKDLVLVGGGHSHVSVLKGFAMKPIPGVRLTLISRDIQAPYSGMLPGLIAGHYDFDQAHIDLGPLARFAGARFYHDQVTGFDLKERRVHCHNRPSVPYDILSINIGSSPDTSKIPGAEEHSVRVKPIDQFLERWEALSARILETRDLVRIGVVGAGAGGVELLLSLQYRLKKLLIEQGQKTDRLEFHLITQTDTILPSHNRRVQNKFWDVLISRGVSVHTEHKAVRVEGGIVFCDPGNAVPLDDIFWVTNAGAPEWLRNTDLALDGDGFIRVDETLMSTSHPNVFAAGDVAGVSEHPRPKSGVFAVRQGPPLTKNLRRALLGKPLKPFRPQSRFLSLISTGNKYAVASRGDWAFSGRAVWRWKDWIDRRFMKKFNELPEMTGSPAPNLPHGLADADVLKSLSDSVMRCGGCGAKVGATVLARALDRISDQDEDGVLIGLSIPDDAAVMEIPPGKLMVHTIDSFRAFIEDPYVFGKIAANHALGDIHAMGASPYSALAIATLPFGLESKVEDHLFQMMSGAKEILHAAGAKLVGGHTGEGAELSLGFSINGLASPDQILRKGGLQPGNRLIISKALGTGALFAADMRAKARGQWIEGALDSMTQSNGDAATCLSRFGATACTDVSGFGLLGHMVEMIGASGVEVDLDLNALPVLDGVRNVLAEGIFSSLYPQNIRLRRSIRNSGEAASHPLYPLIFDPQTAGGLLASVPDDKALACVDALRDLGYEKSAIIGAVKPEGNRREPVTLLI